MNRLVLFALGAILHPSIVVRDVGGVRREPLKVEKGRFASLVFVTNDCPISNYYAQEIRRTCEAYAPRGVECTLVYVDPTMTDQAALSHATAYGHGHYTAVVDIQRSLVEATGVTVTPEVVVIGPDEKIAYRGRIDNYYAALTKPRAAVTEHNWRDALDAVVSGQPVAKPEVPAVGCTIPDKKFYRR